MPKPRRTRTPWADLLRRVFAIDVLECPRCRARLRIIAIVHSPASVRRILESLGLPARAPPIAPPRCDLRFDPDPDSGSFPIDR